MAGIKEIVKRLQRTEPPSLPYVADYVVSEVDAKRSWLPISKYPGLLLYYVVRSSTSPVRVLTYWASREHFHRDGTIFQNDICANSPASEGFVSRLTIPNEPFWKRVPWVTVVLGIAAFFGAIQAIGNHFDWIFSSPNLAFRMDKPRIHLIEGSEFQEVASLLNYLPVAHRHVDISAALLSESQTKVPLSIVPAQMASLSGGASEEVIVSGIAPTAGTYRLVVEAKASAGVIRSARTFRHERVVTVWPKVPSGGLVLKTAQGDMALFSGSISVGPAAPNGLECELEIKGVPGLRYDGVLQFSRLSETGRWRMNESSGDEVASLRWAVLPVTSHEQLGLQIALRKTVELDWSRVARASTINCHYRKEAPRDTR